MIPGPARKLSGQGIVSPANPALLAHRAFGHKWNIPVASVQHHDHVGLLGSRSTWATLSGNVRHHQSSLEWAASRKGIAQAPGSAGFVEQTWLTGSAPTGASLGAKRTVGLAPASHDPAPIRSLVNLENG